MKKCGCQQNSIAASRDLCANLDLLKENYNFVKFHGCRMCVTDFRVGGSLCSLPSENISAKANPKWG